MFVTLNLASRRIFSFEICKSSLLLFTDDIDDVNAALRRLRPYRRLFFLIFFFEFLKFKL